MARHYFPGLNPIGQRILVDPDPHTGGWFGSHQPYEIVGLAGDAKTIELRDPPFPIIYFDLFQENRLQHQFLLRTTVDPLALSSSVERTMNAVLKTVPVTRLTTLAEQVDSNIVPEHLIATLSQSFGLLGAVIAGLGLYGLLAFTLARRTSEVAIRRALGATTRDVISLIVRDALAMVAAGLFAGMLLVLAAKPLVVRFVQDLKPDAAAAIHFGAWIIFAVAFLASSIPVRRAVRIEPMRVLRHD